MDSKVISSPPPPPPPPPFATSPLPISGPKKATSELNETPPPPQHSNRKVHVPFPLHKAKSWSPNIHQQEAWRRQRKNQIRRSRSTSKTTLTDSDFDELKACFELGFSFDSSSKLDPKLSKTFPALEFYHDVLNKKFTKNISRSSSLPSLKSKGIATKNPKSIVEPGDDPETVKMKLRHWAQVVALDIQTPK